MTLPPQLPPPPPDDRRHWRVRATQHTPGGHVQVGLWAGTAQQATTGSPAKVGQLVMGAEDWPSLARLLASDPATVPVTFDLRLLDWDDLADVLDAEATPAAPQPLQWLLAVSDLTDAPPGTAPLPDPVVGVRVPGHLDRVWVEVSGLARPRKGAAAWALSLLDAETNAPRYVVQGTFPPNAHEVGFPIRDERWMFVDPGEDLTWTLRLDGADWSPSPVCPVHLEIAEQPRRPRP